MDFNEACRQMDKGNVVLSDVSSKLYEIKNSCLLANGIIVPVDYISSEEANGSWVVIKSHKRAELIELTSEEVNCLLNKSKI